MTSLTISNLSKSFKARKRVTVIEDLDLHVMDGEMLVLLGPSGCGKTTALRCISGLEVPDRGAIRFDDTTVFDSDSRVNTPPERRSIGMVFQSYALWPHMTVRKNIEYPLRRRGLRSKIAEGWVEEAARLVDCSALLDRYPAQLSGGQQQRVALARGLVARPDVVLFDEPLSNLDTRLRDSVRSQLHELHRSLGFTGVFVTHDQGEAFALGSRMAIMRSGAIDQIGTPQEVYEHPRTEYVADFIGLTNALDVWRDGDIERMFGVRLSGRALLVEGAAKARVRLRPTDIELSPPGTAAADVCSFPAVVVDMTYGGNRLDVMVDIDGHRLHAQIDAGGAGSWQRDLRTGTAVTGRFDPAAARLYGPDGANIPVPLAEGVPA
ncbi:ABC transporter ATP-binding protein [Rhodococcus rhodochrous]|uniref:Trehalose import ATP-binding protein SugC n=1 Tax=Rhodococcus rhodochrous TaxID=1829 RepID=A0AAW4XPM8_RHORH|nr:ABC transporter ATP-binding protein [Rhodococcus rhodochrous]MCD2114630.1 ABC transporter ATP-binding protein [Rhodococcus rhodochrous]